MAAGGQGQGDGGVGGAAGGDGGVPEGGGVSGANRRGDGSTISRRRLGRHVMHECLAEVSSLAETARS